MTERAAESLEMVLRDELARGDAVIATARPILRHLLTSDDSGLFSDQLVARVRGMLTDVAQQLLFAQAAAAAAPDDRRAYVASRLEPLERALREDAGLLAHLHALALEAHLLDRLQGRSAIDPVLTPLVNDRLAAGDAEVAGVAMAVIAAQARFQQRCRRMELPLYELPGDLIHRVLLVMRNEAGKDDPATEDAERHLRNGYREGVARLGLISRLVAGLGHDLEQALQVDQAGVSVFASALSMASGQDRDVVMLSLAEQRGARLVIALRAAGLEPRVAVAQLLHFHPGVALPSAFEGLRTDRAAALLASPTPQASA